MPKTIEISEDGFLNMLYHHKGGGSVAELDREMINCIGSVLDFNGKAELKITATFKRTKGLQTGFNVELKIDSKPQKEPEFAQSMFLTQGNGLSVQMQTQGNLGLGEEVDTRKPNLTPVSPIKGDKK